jgi:cytochrome c
VEKACTREIAHPEAVFAKLRHRFIDASLGLWSQLLMSRFCSLLVVTTFVLAPALCVADGAPDIEHGKTTFNTMCNVCHSVQTTGSPGEGPNLWGLVGRPAGSQPDFTKYSDALKASGLTWSTQNLDKFLVNPMAMVPGTFMPMLIPDDKTRADVIAYLATLKPQEVSE